MTKTKLEIIGPYTPEHEGPFCTRGGNPVELKFRDGRGKRPAGGYIADLHGITVWRSNGRYVDDTVEDSLDLMNAREVPIAREFWINRYPHNNSYYLYTSEDEARDKLSHPIGHTIHVREVLPGDGE